MMVTEKDIFVFICKNDISSFSGLKEKLLDVEGENETELKAIWNNFLLIKGRRKNKMITWKGN